MTLASHSAAPVSDDTPPPARPRSGLAFADFDAFDAAITSSFVPLAVTASPAVRFAGRLRSADADRIVFSEVTASAHEVHRSPALIERGGCGYFKLSVMLSGTGILVQDQREVTLSVGDVAIYDTGRPYSLAFDDEFRNFVVMLPKELIDVPPELVGELTATHLARESALGAIVAHTLPNMPAAIANAPGFVRHQLAQTTADLVTTLLSSSLGQERLDQDPRQALIRKIRAYIAEHLHAPDLGPDRVAAAHFVSPRRLHGLFQGEDTTVAAYIRTLRLERCHADLMNPAYADRSVSAIASRWCFMDAAHFSRTFRSHFGVSPRDLRLAAPA